MIGRDLVIHFYNHIPGIRIGNLHRDGWATWLRILFPIKFENVVAVTLTEMDLPIGSFLDRESLAGELAFRLVQLPLAYIGGVSGT